MCLLVVATLPKAVVPWHLRPASTPSVRKHSTERMELETYCAWLPAPLRVPMCLLRGSIKGADVTVSRPVPSPGPSFQLTSEQFIHGAGWCEGSGVVSTSTGGALSLSAMNRLQQSSKALWKTLLQLTGTFFFFGASNKACKTRTSMLVFLQSFHPRERRRSLWTVRFCSSRAYGSGGKAGLQRGRLMRQLARCDASLYGLLAVEVHRCLLEGLLAFCSRFSQFLAFHQVYFRF